MSNFVIHCSVSKYIIYPGFAYIEYENSEDAKNALRHMDGGQIDGQEVTAAPVLMPRIQPRRRSPPRRQRSRSPPRRRSRTRWTLLSRSWTKFPLVVETSRNPGSLLLWPGWCGRGAV